MKDRKINDYLPRKISSASNYITPNFRPWSHDGFATKSREMCPPAPKCKLTAWGAIEDSCNCPPGLRKKDIGLSTLGPDELPTQRENCWACLDDRSYESLMVRARARDIMYVARSLRAEFEGGLLGSDKEDGGAKAEKADYDAKAENAKYPTLSRAALEKALKDFARGGGFIDDTVHLGDEEKEDSDSVTKSIFDGLHWFLRRETNRGEPSGKCKYQVRGFAVDYTFH